MKSLHARDNRRYPVAPLCALLGVTKQAFYKYDEAKGLFKNLLKHDAYRKKFIDTFCIMAGSVFEKRRASAIVDELADHY